MDKNNVLDFKTMSNKKLQEQFELEGCAEELLDLVLKLSSCDPAGINTKKKETAKAELLAKIQSEQTETRGAFELSDEELDSAAGGIRLPENNNPKPKPPNGSNGQ